MLNQERSVSNSRVASLNTTDTDERDATLMAGWQQGSDAAFAELYAHHKDRLYAFLVRSAAGDQEAATEMAQDIWMQIIRYRNRYDGRRFSSWLYAIARNRLTDHHRACAVRQTLVGYEDDTTPHAHLSQTPLQPEELAEARADGKKIQAALDGLPDEQREALLLRHTLGFSIAEIAELTGSGHETVKSRLRYATSRMRERLRNEREISRTSR